MKTKLILLEGLPGSGKSTFSRFVSIQMERQQQSVRWYHEVAKGHPTSSFEETCLREAALEKWRHFVQRALEAEETVLLESSLFQFQIYGQLLENLPAQEITQWVRQLMEIIAPLQPVLIYLYQEDVERAIQKMFEVRGMAWVQSIVERDAGLPYFQARSTPGVETYAGLLKEYRRIADELFAECEFRKIGIENSGREWARYEGQILDFLQLEHRPDPLVEVETLQRLTGVYTCAEAQVSVEISLAEGNLHFGKSRKRLIPKAGLTFYINDNSVEVTFAQKEDQGWTMTMGGLPLIDAWSATGLVYRREDGVR